jgi:hypothetical protein
MTRGKGEGSIRKRKDGRWEAALSVGYTPKGNPKRVSVYGKTRKEVSDKLFHLGSKFGKGLPANPDKITVFEFLNQWLEDKSDTKKPTTVAGYRNAVEKHIVPKLGKVRLQQLQPTHVQNLYRELRRDRTREQFAPGSLRVARRIQTGRQIGLGGRQPNLKSGRAKYNPVRWPSMDDRPGQSVP